MSDEGQWIDVGEQNNATQASSGTSILTDDRKCVTDLQRNVLAIHEEFF